jgi:hypothetical protein
MKTLKSLFLVVGLAVLPQALFAADLMKPKVFLPIGPTLRDLIGYSVNKLDRASPLTEEQKSAIRTILDEEATKLDGIQRANRGDVTSILRDALPVICATSAGVLEVLNADQRKAAGIAFVEERREGFLNTLNLRITDLFMRYEAQAGLPKLMGTE